MIIQSNRKPELLLPDMSFMIMTNNQTFTEEILTNYKVLCPIIFYAEIYNEVSDANRRLENPFEVVYIEPWQILAKNELEGQLIVQDGNIAPIHLRSEQDMNEEEIEIVENAQNLVEVFDANDRFLSAQSPISRSVGNHDLASFANAPYQNLTWNQFIERFREVSQGTIYEPLACITEMPITNRNTARRAIENALSGYAEMYPIDNFKKAFAFSKLMLEGDFTGICNNIFIPMLVDNIGLDRTHWDNTRDRLADSRIRESFPYTWYVLYHYLAFHVYQNENTYNARVGSRDFEYLYYLYFSNVLFVSADAQHEKYITGAEEVKSRGIGSFAYIPHRNDNPDEHDKVMKYIKEGVLY